MMIDSRQATEALSDIDQIVRRVRQSRIYNLASLTMMLWGGLAFAGYVGAHLWPRTGYYSWAAVYVVGITGSIALSAFNYARSGVRTFDSRMLSAFVLYIAFGIFFSAVLGHFTPRQLGTFWPIYILMMYAIAGLWVGYAFIAISLSIIALTMIGYFFIGGWFDLWMAVVNGGGLVLGGLWMRRS